MSVRMSRGKVLPNAQLAVAPSDAYAGSRGLDAEIYTEVPSRVTLETLLSGTVPPTGGLVKIAADAASYSYVIDLSLRVEVRKLFDLNVQKLSFSAQLTVTLEWLVDEGVYEAYAAFWDAYRPQLWLPASSRPGDVMKGASKKTTTRQYAKAHSPAVASQRMRHVSLEVTDTFTFKQPFDLRTFPFDTQALQVVFESPPVEVWGRRFGARLRAPLHEPHVVAAGADLLPSNDICFVYGVAGGFPEAPKALAARGERFPERTAAVLIFVERDPTGVVNNVIVPTALFQLLSLVANWIDPCALQFRLGVNLTILLTMAAKQVYVSSLLPRVAFLTPPELAVNWTIFLLFVQSWLKVVSAHLCFPRIRRPFLTVRDFYYEKKIRKTSGADAPWLASSVVDRACEVFTLAVFLGTSLHVLRLYLARRTLRRKLQDARANRDDGFFRRYGERNYDFCNAAQAEVLTEGPKMFLCYTEDDSAGASLNGDDHRVIVFDIGTGEVKALRYAFSPAAGVSVVEIASKREPLSEALREGGAALDAFVAWFSDVLYADVVLDGGGGAYGSWAAAGLAWRGPVVASVKPGSLADAAGVRAGWCLWGGPPLDAADGSAATRASVPMDADVVNMSHRRFEEQLSTTLEFLRSKKIPKSVCRKVKEYYYLRYNDGRLYDEAMILDNLSPELRKEVWRCSSRELIPKVPLFREHTTAFFDALAVNLTPTMWFPGDVIVQEGSVGKHVFFIHTGLCSLHLRSVEDDDVRILADGCFFGEAAILLKTKRSCTVRACTMVETFVVEEDVFTEVCDEFPEIADYLHKLARQRQTWLKHLDISRAYRGVDAKVVHPDYVDPEDALTPLFQLLSIELGPTHRLGRHAMHDNAHAHGDNSLRHSLHRALSKKKEENERRDTRRMSALSTILHKNTSNLPSPPTRPDAPSNVLLEIDASSTTGAGGRRAPAQKRAAIHSSMMGGVKAPLASAAHMNQILHESASHDVVASHQHEGEHFQYRARVRRTSATVRSARKTRGE